MAENITWLPIHPVPSSSPAIHIDVWIESLTVTSCILSAIGSILIILTFIIWRDLRTKTRELLVYLSVTTFFVSVSYAYGIIEDFHSNPMGCTVQSAITTFSETSSFFWTVAIAMYLYALVAQSSQVVMNRLVWLFHFVCWGVPLITVIVAVSFGALGYDDSYTSVGWCWVDLDVKHRIMWMLLVGKMWEIASYFILPLLYILIKRKFKRFVSDQNQVTVISNQGLVTTVTLKIDVKLTFIPIVFLVLHIWSTVRFVLTVYDCNAVSNPILILLHGIGNSFQGAANCIMFCLCNNKIRHRCKRACRRLTRGCCTMKCCQRRTRNDDSTGIVNTNTDNAFHQQP
ncbi:G-protein coupled receptor 157-like [Antedon mediterranea]|uniref:G-protein coupled receptor 157-like n=1 Tax=Antedon mediterranea TaxID=105859 RepID=UPI003AF9DF0E